MKPKPVQPVQLTPAKYAAIHRALISGLVSNIGQRSKDLLYTTPRSAKFALFPGSSQFSKNPPWVICAELVRTSRLYGHTIARIDPQWIESAAPHLTKRTHSNPRWQPLSGHVIADERLSLYGLVLIPARRVQYAPIDPHITREIFIHHALVLGQWRTRGQFARHNHKLLQRILTAQAKLRRNDLITDPAQRFAFFNARIPPDILNGPDFEAWRLQAEAAQPDLLYLSWHDLYRSDAPTLHPGDFPDTLTAGSATLKLRYVFDPASPDDGITATIPLSLLNQIPPEPLAWGIKGHLEQKIHALIRTLPKPLRTRLIPAHSIAQTAAASIPFGQGPFLPSLAHHLGNLAGTIIPSQAFAPQRIPTWLQINLRVIDSQGRTIRTGRDLRAIQTQLGLAARESFADLHEDTWHKDGLLRWDFGDLPPSVEIYRHGDTLLGYPALVDAGPSISLRLFDSPALADQNHRAGVRRLFLLQIAHESQELIHHIADLDTLEKNYAPLATPEKLAQSILAAATDKALFTDQQGQSPDLPRTREDFIHRSALAWQNLNLAAQDILAIARPTLAAYQQVLHLLDRASAVEWQPATADIRAQLASLLPADFLVRTPWRWLQHFPRYLSATLARLQKLLDYGLHKDTDKLRTIGPLFQAFHQLRRHQQSAGIIDPQLDLYGWMLEEYRTSLFAQELGTSLPISPERLKTQWDKILKTPS